MWFPVTSRLIVSSAEITAGENIIYSAAVGTALSVSTALGKTVRTARSRSPSMQAQPRAAQHRLMRAFRQHKRSRAVPRDERQHVKQADKRSHVRRWIVVLSGAGNLKIVRPATPSD
jgi:hypothetical protein